MSPGPWRTAYASVAGTSHQAVGKSCQDAGRCVVARDRSGTDVLVAAVSDGAGSVSRSERGATLAVASFLEVASEAVRADEGGLTFLDGAFALQWIERARAAISDVARDEGSNDREYACTFLGAVVGPGAAGYLQIGDGAIVIIDDVEVSEPRWVFWPQHGEFANSTNFITQSDARETVQFQREDLTERRAPVREIALFTDGLERLVLDFSARKVHPPALGPIFGWLAGTEVSADGPSEVLEAYLRSSHVNRRTDDDKTLVMACRPARPGNRP